METFVGYAMKKLTDRKNTRLIYAIALILFFCAPGCGKKIAPVPQDYKNVFFWKSSAGAINARGCLSVGGELQGSVNNVQRFMLEVEAVTEELCIDCPFMPREIVMVHSESDVAAAPQFTYCPSAKAPAYRWRLVAQNVYRALPHAVTPVAVAD
jgi:hypothetical protein